MVQTPSQQLIDCVKPSPSKEKTDCSRCYLLAINKAFKWVIGKNGIAREKRLPIYDKNGDCKQIEKVKYFILNIVWFIQQINFFVLFLITVFDSLIVVFPFDENWIVNIIYSTIQQQPVAGAIRITTKSSHLKKNVSKLVIWSNSSL